MTVLLVINILLVAVYVGATIWRMKGLPESISAMVYELPRKWQWVWSAWLVAVAFTLMPVLLEKLPDGVEFLGFLTTIGLVGAAVTPLIQLETRKWHYIFAIGAGVLGQMCVAVLSPWWLLLWFGMIGVLCVMLEWPESRAAKVLRGKGVFIAECICYVTLVCSIQ
jgi:hypothetical protein